MKILVLSDLYWNSSSKKITNEDLVNFVEAGVPSYSEKFRNVIDYWKVIVNENPDLVLLAGDITGDGSCGHGYHMPFLTLVSLLEKAKTPTLFLRGDNDLDSYYDFASKVVTHYTYVNEVSDQVVKHKGINILGLSFQATRNKGSLKAYINHRDEPIDILFCHSELKRRTHLFESNAPIIITGHFDNKLCCIDNKIFVSLSNDSSIINYCTLNLAEESEVAYHFLDRKNQSRISLREKLRDLLSKRSNNLITMDGVPLPIEEFEKLPLPKSREEKDKNALAFAIKFLRGHNYSNAIELLRSSKVENNYKVKEIAKARKAYITPNHTLSKSMIMDYLGNRMRKYLN